MKWVKHPTLRASLLQLRALQKTEQAIQAATARITRSQTGEKVGQPQAGYNFYNIN